jgi:hypothetical protein
MEKSAVYVRLDALENLIYRTAERRSGLDYRDAGSPMQDIKSTYPLFISKARAGSFAMSVRIGSPLGEPIFPQWREGLTVENVLDDVVEGLESVNSGRLDSLHERIPEEAYFRNFVSLSRSLSPDGGRVTQCALTLVRGTSRREVSLTKLRKDIRIPTTERPGETLVVVRGVLKYADELRPAKREIRLVDSDNNEVKISVPQGLNDIVRPLWGRLVEVEGGKTRNRISLREIREVEADEEPPSFPYRPTSPEPGSLFR